jgi:acyl-CoA thioesterase-1
MTHPIPRRTLLAAAGALGIGGGALGAAPGGGKVVTILGDSITAGYGLPAGTALPAQLGLELARLGGAAQVRPSGVSGDTTADGLARVDFSVKPDTALCIVALGGNDLLQGVDPKAMRANLEGILARLKARHIPVLLLGLTAPAAMGAGYARDFDAVFPALARADHVPLYPNLLAGVMLDSSLNQPDGVHPNARGVKIIAARLAPTVIAALKALPRSHS